MDNNRRAVEAHLAATCHVERRISMTLRIDLSMRDLNIFARSLSRAVKDARDRAGYTQNELARRLCVSPRTIARWESGKSKPSSSAHKSALARFFEQHDMPDAATMLGAGDPTPLTSVLTDATFRDAGVASYTTSLASLPRTPSAPAAHARRDAPTSEQAASEATTPPTYAVTIQAHAFQSITNAANAHARPAAELAEMLRTLRLELSKHGLGLKHLEDTLD